MLSIDPTVPLKNTISYLSTFPRFSLIEKIEPKFFPTSADASRKVAEEIRDAIKAKAEKTAQPFILGLATGSTPLKVYKELIKMYKEGDLSFKNVVTFNLDQYYPIAKDNIESYNYYMRDNLFNHVDIPKENINIPDGEIPKDKVTLFCENYEKKIKAYGGIDLQILGIGRTGHIGFNEPPSPIKSITRLVYLHRLTRKDAANSFNGIENVPKCAITMGIETISKAKRIIIMAWSETKASIVQRSIEGSQCSTIPSTFLHNHHDAVFYLDKGAGELLSRFKVPWTIKGDKEDPIVPYTKYWIIKMVLWLSAKINKPILRLTFEDYEDHGLSPLVMDVAKGNYQDLNLYAYKNLHAKITGWPLGGRPHAFDDSKQIPLMPKVSSVKSRVLIFSPHPDDDVLSMGATMKKLREQGHQVMVAYMTTGSNSVHDHEALKYIHFLRDFLSFNQKLWSCEGSQHLKDGVEKLIEITKDAGDILKKKKIDTECPDGETIRCVKSLIRSSEGKIAVDNLCIDDTKVYCLQLPFYTHHAKRKDISEDDKLLIRNVLKLTEPDYVFAAGDLSDPHGTHRKCLNLLLSVYEEEKKKAEEDSTYQSLFPVAEKILFYRGAWDEWDLPVCRVIVPLSPSDVDVKMSSILRHQSQKDAPMFPGEDPREFWERARTRNRETAEKLKLLGFSDYEAAECFVNLNDLKNYEEL